MTSTTLKFALCCCVMLFLGESRLFGYAMECDDPEDEGICNRFCQSRGASYGRCDYSDCNCYGRRRIGSFESDSDDFQNRLHHDLRASATQTPATQKKPLICSSSVRASGKTRQPTYQSCRAWCDEAQFEIYMALGNLCCCRKKE